jgi:hypothetical protein
MKDYSIELRIKELDKELSESLFGALQEAVTDVCARYEDKFTGELVRFEKKYERKGKLASMLHQVRETFIVK